MHSNKLYSTVDNLPFFDSSFARIHGVLKSMYLFDLEINFQISAIASFVIGLYDGFFGPGTGTFYTILFSFMGLPLIFSAGTTKVLNLTSNIAAFVTFIINGTIFFNVGLPCAIASIIGNILGSNYAIKKEGKAIKKLLVIVIALLYIKIVSELIF